MSTSYLYRFYCNTEKAFVYRWATQPPSTCPNSLSHSIDTSTITVIDRSITGGTSSGGGTTTDSQSRMNFTPFQELETVEKTPIMELKSLYGKTALRDVYLTTGMGTVTNEVGEGEYRLRVVGDADTALLQTTERGRYIAGHSAQVGIGVRIPVIPTNGVQAKWGLFDDNNGFYYVYDGQGFGVCVLRDGVETRINKAQFNKDKLDGTGPSGINIDLTNGHIFQIVFSWYGYGVIDFVISTSNPTTLNQESISVHSYFSSGTTTIRDPNLPIRAIITTNAGNTQDFSMYVTGRQYAILGKYVPIKRVNSAYVVSVPISSTSSFQHILSIRKKQGYASNAVKIDSLDYLANAYMILQLRVNTTVFGGSYTNIPDQDPNETVMEMNQTATSVSGGIVIWSGIAPTDRAGLQQMMELMYTVPEYSVISLMAKAINTENGQLTSVLRWTEEW